jgi:guanylate kinase
MGKSKPKDLVLSDGQIIPRFDHTDFNNLLNQSIIVYGPSQTGKTSLINYLLKSLTNEVAMGWAIAPNEPHNEDYKGVFPIPCIHFDAEHASVLQFMSDLWDRQESITSIYKLCNNKDTLKTICKKFNLLDEYDDKIERIKNIREKIKHDKTIEDKDKFNKQIDQKFIKLYKAILIKYYTPIMKNAIKLLTDLEQICMNNLDVNPHCVFIMDDCIAQLKKLQKTPIFKRYMTRARHVKITFIIVAHSVTQVDREIRGLAFKSIFTTEEMARDFLNKQSSTMESKHVKLGHAIINEVFKEKYRPFIFAPECSVKFSYFVSNREKVKEFGSKAIWQFIKRIPMSNGIDKSNSLYKKLVKTG